MRSRRQEKSNADAIADLAVENFAEMRDRVADPRFLLRKKVELALGNREYPQLFVPKYAMVTFHRIPYATALKRGQVQDHMLAELCDPIARVEDLDWSKADRLIRGELTPMEWFRDGRAFMPAKVLRLRWMPTILGALSSSLYSKDKNEDDCIYLCGHSLGLQPKKASSYLEQELRDWAQLGVEETFHAKNPWVPYHRMLAQPN